MRNNQILDDALDSAERVQFEKLKAERQNAPIVGAGFFLCWFAVYLGLKAADYYGFAPQDYAENIAFITGVMCACGIYTLFAGLKSISL